MSDAPQEYPTLQNEISDIGTIPGFDSSITGVIERAIDGDDEGVVAGDNYDGLPRNRSVAFDNLHIARASGKLL